MALFLEKHFGEISHQQNNDNYIKLETFLQYLKTNIDDEDKIKFRRGNVIRALKVYEQPIVINNEELVSLSAILRFVFNYSNGLKSCYDLERDVCLQLSNSQSHPSSNISQGEKELPSTILQIYKLVLTLPFKVLKHANILEQLTLKESEISTLFGIHKDNFTEEEWKKICIFEINFANSVGVRDRNISKEIEKRFDFYNLCLKASVVAEEWALVSKKTIATRRQRFHANDQECDIQFVGNEVHLFSKMDEELSEHAQLYFPNVFHNILVVPGTSVGSIDIYAELKGNLTDDPKEIADFLAGIVERRHKIICQSVIFFISGSFQQFRGKYIPVARFALRDSVVNNKLNQAIAYISKCCDIFDEDGIFQAKSDKKCENCFRGIAHSPLSSEKFDILTEWFSGVPLITQILFEEFISTASLHDSTDPKECVTPKLRKLYHCYDTMLNVVTQKYTGVIQKLNTKELLMFSKNVHTVFQVTSNSGATMSLMSAERFLDKCAEPDLCRYNTYVKSYSMSYETDLGIVSKMISLKDDCYIILMLDNLVRLKFKNDPNPGECRSKQLNTLPITIQGLPRDSVIVTKCHDDQICDGTEDCSCKSKKNLTRDNLRIFVDLLPEEEETMQCFQQLLSWGFSNLWKILSENDLLPALQGDTASHNWRQMAVANETQPNIRRSPSILTSENNALPQDLEHTAVAVEELGTEDCRHMAACNETQQHMKMTSLTNIPTSDDNAFTPPDSGKDINRRHIAVDNKAQQHLRRTSLFSIPSDADEYSFLSQDPDNEDMSHMADSSETRPHLKQTPIENFLTSENEFPSADPGSKDKTSVDLTNETNPHMEEALFLDILNENHCENAQYSQESSEEESEHLELTQVSDDELAVVISNAICCDIHQELEKDKEQLSEAVSDKWFCGKEEDMPSIMPERFGLKKYIVPPLLTRHPPPASGRDDDILKLREILDDLLLKLEFTQKDQEKILFGPDHKIGQNLLKLKQESDRYANFLAEFPLLHTRKHKITVLFSAYKDAGLLELIRFMREDEEQDWNKLVTLNHIDIATRYIRRLSAGFHIAFLVSFITQLTPTEAALFQDCMKTETPESISKKWHEKFSAFLEKGCKTNATFCLHADMMRHCDCVIAVSLAERLGGRHGYLLLLAAIKSSLLFSFVNGASAYAPFCTQLLAEHYKCGPFYQNLKMCLFSTPLPGSSVNFSGDTKRELDHKDAMKSFHSGSTLQSVLRKMSLVDSFKEVHAHFSEGYGLKPNEVDHLGWKLKAKDWQFIIPIVRLILRRGGVSTEVQVVPQNVYVERHVNLDPIILDCNSTPGAGLYLLMKTVAENKIIHDFRMENLPDPMTMDGAPYVMRKVKGQAKTIRRSTIKRTQAILNKSADELKEDLRKKNVAKEAKRFDRMSSLMNTCQAIVRPDCTKPIVQKSKTMQSALLDLLNATSQNYGTKYEPHLIKLQCDIPTETSRTIAVVIIEFAGVKFKAKVPSGDAYIKYVQNVVLLQQLRRFPQVRKVIVCEEKYSFTPDELKAATREQRKKKLHTIAHLKSSKEMVTSNKIAFDAILNTVEGKWLISNYLATNVDKLDIRRDVKVVIDSEMLSSQCQCVAASNICMCPKFSTPIEVQFSTEQGYESVRHLNTVRQKKGEAEMAQADWLVATQPTLKEGEGVMSVVTSGDIDAIVVHLFTVSLYFQKGIDGKYKNHVYVLLEKPKKKIDIFDITGILEFLEKSTGDVFIGAKVALGLCMGGNDFIPKFYGFNHSTVLQLLFKEERFAKGLFAINQQKVAIDRDLYVEFVKTLYCRRIARSSNPEDMPYDEVRHLSIVGLKKKKPTRCTREPQLWLPPKSCVERLATLMELMALYLGTAGTHDCDLPDFESAECLMKSSSGIVKYDFGPESHVPSIENVYQDVEKKITNEEETPVKFGKRMSKDTPSKRGHARKRLLISS